MLAGIQELFSLLLSEQLLNTNMNVAQMDPKLLAHVVGEKGVVKEVGRIQWTQVNQALDLKFEAHHKARLYANRHYEYVIQVFKELSPVVRDLHRMLSIEKLLRANKIDVFSLDDSELSNKYRDKYINAFVNISMCIRMNSLGFEGTQKYLSRYKLI